MPPLAAPGWAVPVTPVRMAGGEGVAAQQNFIPALIQCILHQVVPRRGVPPVLSTRDTGKPVGLRNGLKALVVILPAPADLFDLMLAAVEMYHLMEHGVKGLFYGVVEHFGGNIQLIGFVVLPLPDLGDGTVSHCPRLALDRDDRCWQLPTEEVSVEGIIDVFQLRYRPAHFCCLFHDFVNLPKYRSGAAQLARELVSTQPAQTEQTVKTGRLRPLA